MPRLSHRAAPPRFFPAATAARMLTGSIMLLAGCADELSPGSGSGLVPASQAEPTTGLGWAEAVQEAHGVAASWQYEVARADIDILFGGQMLVDSTFTFELHGPRARMDSEAGWSVIYDGAEAYLSPANVEVPRGRFHVLTWPWFVIAPLKTTGEGIELHDLARREFRGKPSVTLLQTFAQDAGDTPDDWYRLIIDPETRELEAMSYIVTHGQSQEEAEEDPSLIIYEGYLTVQGVKLATDYSFHPWDAEAFEIAGPQKGTGTIRNIELIKTPEQGIFAIPEGARKLRLPDGF